MKNRAIIRKCDVMEQNQSRLNNYKISVEELKIIIDILNKKII